MSSIPLLNQLRAEHRPAILAHLLRLEMEDRTQRFGQPVATEIVERYVEQLDFSRDAHFGILHRDQDGSTQLIGHTHLGIDARGLCGEIGVSVERPFQRRGLATRMLTRAIVHARNVGVREIVMYFLPYNTSLMELARSLGMSLSLGSGEGMARLANLSASPVSMASEWLDLCNEVGERTVGELAQVAGSTSEQMRRLLAGQLT
ncbi:GNAT family N-acetyltransferase [Chitinimonas lacunae]|uniref:GNAT family N-acetyltransferase n=1 Tax=Chitinimonas lacunae TaxID=1963018 RepID=A0ABV8MLK9_9NEIS